MRRKFLLFASLLTAIPACSPPPSATSSRRPRPAPQLRIVSCAPSITETLFALQLGPSIVLDTTSCDYPPDAKKKAHFNAVSSDIEPILAANPMLVIAQKGLDTTLIPPLEKSKLPLLQIQADTLPDYYLAVEQIGNAAGRKQQAKNLVASIKTQIEAVRRVTSQAKRPVRLLILYSVGPAYTTGPGSFMDDLIKAAGGINLVTVSPPGSVLSPEEVVAKQPDAILCPADLIPQIRKMPGWNSLPAVKQNHLFTIGEEFERPGPRMGQAVRELAMQLHPTLMKKFASPVQDTAP